MAAVKKSTFVVRNNSYGTDDVLVYKIVTAPSEKQVWDYLVLHFNDDLDQHYSLADLKEYVEDDEDLKEKDIDQFITEGLKYLKENKTPSEDVFNMGKFRQILLSFLEAWLRIDDYAQTEIPLIEL